MVKCIGVLTSGGDAPGMNAAVRAVARTCLNKGIEVYGVRLGYKGLYEGDFIKFDRHSTRNIINLGGTILKSASYNGALKLTEMGVNCIGIPGTIDNDIPDTDFTVGFDTALNTIVDALDRLRDTSSSHQRCTILEVMGRRCGDLAINAGIADGAEMIITSEIGFDESKVIERLKASKESDKKHAIVVITEHITDVHELAKKVEAATGFETRANVLGHMQRGGRPSARDRVLASRMGVYAVELLEAGKGGLCVSQVNGEIKGLDIEETLSHKRKTDFGIYEDAMKLR